MKINKKIILLSSFAVVCIVLICIYLTMFSRPQSSESVVDAKKVDFKTDTLQIGYGDEEVEPGDLIAVNYIGSLEDGTIVESNLSSGKPYEVFIGKGDAIKGWDQGLIGMKVGEKRKLVVPPEFGYGNEGKENISKDAVLYYEIELLEIK